MTSKATNSSTAHSHHAASYPNRLCHIDYAAHPYQCGCLRGDEESQRIYDEHCRASSAEPSEPVELDERIAFERFCVDSFNHCCNPTIPMKMELMLAARTGEKYRARGWTDMWKGWKARAALDGQSSHHANYCKAVNERDSLRTLLDEQNALLREIAEDLLFVAPSYRQKAQLLLSVNADPSAPTCGHAACTSLGEPHPFCDSSRSLEQSAPIKCAICHDLGDQCMECEEADFVTWADRHFAAADYRKTAAGVYIQDWMRHSFAAWQARGNLERKR